MNPAIVERRLTGIHTRSLFRRVVDLTARDRKLLETFARELSVDLAGLPQDPEQAALALVDILKGDDGDGFIW